MTVEDLINNYPKEVRKNQFILVSNKGTYAEKILKAYDNEIEAYRILKKCSKKKECIVKGNALFVNIEGINFLYGYEEV